jgi:hypothetical protein
MARPHALQVKHGRQFRELPCRRRVSFFGDRISISIFSISTNSCASISLALGGGLLGGALDGFVHDHVAEQQTVQAKPAEAVRERVGGVGGGVGV